MWVARALAKVLFLFIVREGYLLARNLLGLLLHPYKTLLRIFKERDLSQATLLLGLWAGAWLFLGGLLLVNWLFNPEGFVGLIFKTGIVVGGLLLLLASIYLMFWVGVLLKNLSRTPFFSPKDLL